MLHQDLRIVKSQQATKTTPLERMLASFPAAHQRRNGWWAHDDNPRFDFLETPDGDIRVHSHTGRTVDNVLAMGKPPLSRAHLYAKPGQSSQVIHRDKLDLLTLSQYMLIDWQWLEREGYTDGYTYEYSSGDKVTCVKLGGCFTPDGQEHTKHQIRLSLNEKLRFLWNQNTPGELLPFGLHYLPWARAAGYLFMGEGNSDWATMAFHRLPFIGIPGADQAKTLDVELLKDIPIIYLIEEPDQARKLKRSGQGFYKNMRQHLREGGYAGDIFTIRFMDATGYKDPSDLHKALYAACKEQAEGPFRQEVHNQFLAAIDQAMQAAIPEGNENLFPVAAARDWSKITFEEFSRLVWKVSVDFLSPIQKMIILYLFLYMKEVKPDELGWHIDAAKMAPEVGLQGKKGAKTFLVHLAYIAEKVGIVSKSTRARKEYLNDNPDEPESFRYKGKDVYIEPRPNFYTPGSYCVVPADQHQPGGPRIAFAKCVNCGSERLDRHEWQHCHDCGYDHFKPLYDTPPLAREVPAEEEKVIESTLQETIPESPKMGTSGNFKEDPLIGSDTQPQNGYFGNSPFSLDETIPDWCIPDSLVWLRMVERYGLDETIHRARSWFISMDKFIPPGILREQVAR